MEKLLIFAFLWYTDWFFLMYGGNTKTIAILIYRVLLYPVINHSERGLSNSQPSMYMYMLLHDGVSHLRTCNVGSSPNQAQIFLWKKHHYTLSVYMYV